MEHNQSSRKTAPGTCSTSWTCGSPGASITARRSRRCSERSGKSAWSLVKRGVSKSTSSTSPPPCNRRDRRRRSRSAMLPTGSCWSWEWWAWLGAGRRLTVRWECPRRPSGALVTRSRVPGAHRRRSVVGRSAGEAVPAEIGSPACRGRCARRRRAWAEHVAYLQQLTDECAARGVPVFPAVPSQQSYLWLSKAGQDYRPAAEAVDALLRAADARRPSRWRAARPRPAAGDPGGREAWVARTALGRRAQAPPRVTSTRAARAIRRRAPTRPPSDSGRDGGAGVTGRDAAAGAAASCRRGAKGAATIPDTGPWERGGRPRTRGDPAAGTGRGRRLRVLRTPPSPGGGEGRAAPRLGAGRGLGRGRDDGGTAGAQGGPGHGGGSGIGRAWRPPVRARGRAGRRRRRGRRGGRGDGAGGRRLPAARRCSCARTSPRRTRWRRWCRPPCGPTGTWTARSTTPASGARGAHGGVPRGGVAPRAGGEPDRRLAVPEVRAAGHAASGPAEHRQHRLGGGGRRLPRLRRHVAPSTACSGSPAGGLEYALHGVRVNAVCPGLIDTPMADAFTGGRRPTPSASSSP